MLILYSSCYFSSLEGDITKSSVKISTSDIACIINHDLHDLQLLSNWAIKGLVTFNQLKTEAVLFTLKKLKVLPHLIFDNIAISFVDSHKHLGVT